MSKNQSLMGLMDEMLKQAEHEEKQALSNVSGPEPTSHPVMGADDGTTPAREGARSSENEADIREDYGEAGSSGQEDADAVSDKEKDPADSIGTQTSNAEEMRGNVQQPKSTKDGPAENGRGDSSPSHPTTQELHNQEKYSAAGIVDSGNKLLAALAKMTGNEKVASKGGALPEKKAPGAKEDKGGDGAVKEASEQEKRAAAEKYSEDAEAGYVAAEMLVNQLFGKQAEQEKAAEIAENIIKTAHADAELLHEYLLGQESGTEKAANKRKGHKKQAMPPEAAMGAMPPEAAMAAMPPAAMAAGGGEGEGEMIPPEELAAGEEGGGEEEAIDALAEALAEAGVTPEELAATLAEAEGGGEMPYEEGEGGGEMPYEEGEAGGMAEEGGGEVAPPAAKGEEGGEGGEEPAKKEPPAEGDEEEGKEAGHKAARLKGRLKKSLLDLVRQAS